MQTKGIKQGVYSDLMSNQNARHHYIRVTGFGLSVLPFAPFRVGYGEEGEEGLVSLDILHFATSGEQFARIIADGNGGFRSKLDPNTRSVYDVVEIRAGLARPHWILETSVFTCDWPIEYEVASTAYPQESVILDLLGSHQEQIFLQSFAQLPLLRQMPVQGQKIMSIDDSSGCIDLQYPHQGQLWYQRHRIVPFVPQGVQGILVTCQAPAPLADSVRSAADRVAHSIRFTPEPG
jgi:hypothetical protein